MVYFRRRRGGAVPVFEKAKRARRLRGGGGEALFASRSRVESGRIRDWGRHL